MVENSRLLSGNNQITRRKVLSSTIGAGSATLGASGIAAAASDDETRTRRDRDRHDDEKLTAEDVKKALSHAEVHPLGYNADMTAQSATLPDDVKVYYGEDKNAEVPTGQPYALESYEEFRQREVPVGFESNYDNVVEAQGSGTDFFYVREDIGKVSEFGHTITFAAGAGIQMEIDGSAAASATISADIFAEIDNSAEVSIPISQFGVGYNITDTGICLDNIKFSHSVLRKLDIGVCVSAGLLDGPGDKYKVPLGFEVAACAGADSCPDSWTCEFCQEIGIEKNVTTPPISV